MTADARVQPDGSVILTDGATTYPPLSPEAVQAIAGVAAASANASRTQQMTEGLQQLALLITSAAPAAGASAYAQVTVTPGKATAVLDDCSFALVQDNMPGQTDSSGNWVSGPLVVQKQPSPTPATGGTTP